MLVDWRVHRAIREYEVYRSLDLSSVRRSFHYLFQYELLYNSTADHLSGSNLKDILEKRRHLLFIMLWVAIPGNEIFLMSQLSVRQSDPTGIGFPTKPNSVGCFRCCPLRSLWLWGQVSEGECRDTAYLSVLSIFRLVHSLMCLAQVLALRRWFELIGCCEAKRVWGE